VKERKKEKREGERERERESKTERESTYICIQGQRYLCTIDISHEGSLLI